MCDSPGCLFSSSSSHHLVRRVCSFLIVPVCRLVLPGVLSSHRWGGYRAKNGGRCLSSPFHSHMSWGKWRVMRFLSSSSDVPGLLVPRLALPSRGASRSLSAIMVFARGGCPLLRPCPWRLVGSGVSFVCPAAWRCACPHHSPVVSSASCLVVSCGVSLLVPHVLRAVWRCVLARPIVVLLFSWDVAGWGVLPCLLVSLSGGGFGLSFYPVGSGWAAALVLPSRSRCLLVLRYRRGMRQCRSRHRRSCHRSSRLLSIII